MNFMHRHTSLFNELNKFFEEPLEKAEKKLMKTDNVKETVRQIR